MIYPISDSKLVNPVHSIPKHGGITTIQNDKDEVLPSRTITEYKMCVDFRKLNKITIKEHQPLPFMEQIIDRITSNSYYCILDANSGFSQIQIHPEDQEKTTFTCPYGTYAYRRMPFGLCNASATFQKCMMNIFGNFVEDIVDVLFKNFISYGTTFDHCLYNLTKVLQRCKKTKLVLNWECCHFMVREGFFFLDTRYLRKVLKLTILELLP